MRAYGAKVILTPAERGMEGTIDYAREQVARGGYLMLDQFSNPDNWRAHYATHRAGDLARHGSRRSRTS